MWIKKITPQDHTHASRAVVQLTPKGAYMSVQDKHGAILATAKWGDRATYQQVIEMLKEEGLYPLSEWRQPRQGVLVLDVRDVK